MIEALERLREWSHCVDNAYVADNGFMFAEINAGEKIREFADEIQAEVDSKYLLLPVDSEGVPIRVNDMLRRDGDGSIRKVYAVGNDTFVTWDSCEERYGLRAPSLWSHVKPRTVEDVLMELVDETARQGHQIGLTAQEIVTKYADEIRELMAND